MRQFWIGRQKNRHSESAKGPVASSIRTILFTSVMAHAVVRSLAQKRARDDSEFLAAQRIHLRDS
jgi:hypothetical protein